MHDLSLSLNYWCHRQSNRGEDRQPNWKGGAIVLAVIVVFSILISLVELL